MKKLLCYIVFLTQATYLLAQGEIDDQKKNLIRNERTWIFQLNSNGWGGGFRTGKHLDAFSKRIIDIDFGELRHPKQIKLVDPSSEERYFYGKLNVCYYLSASWGVLRKKYRKFDRGSISISRAISIGAIVGIEKPYYYLVAVDTVGNVQKQLFDSDRSQNIIDNASYFAGFDELSFVPGVNLSVCYLVDLSGDDTKVRAVEFGADLSVFYRPLRMMASEENTIVNLRLFVGYRFGRIYGLR